MRISNNLIINNYLSDLQRTQSWINRLLHQSSTGKAFDGPGDAPYKTSVSLNLSAAISRLTQFSRNVGDGKDQTTYTESMITDVNAQLQRARELTVQGGNTALTRTDRNAIADELNQLLEQIAADSNANNGGRFIFAGYETLTRPFALNRTTPDGQLSSLSYLGDQGQIARGIGVSSHLNINFTGRDFFLPQTDTLQGRQLASGPLGFNGTFEVNNQLFTVNTGMSLNDIRDLINKRSGVNVEAVVTSDYRLNLVSLDSTEPVHAQDLTGTALEDLGLLQLGAYNRAQVAPTLPLVDSRGTIHTGAAIAFPLTIDQSNNKLVLTISGAANNNFRQSLALTLTSQNYASSTALAAEMQKQADFAFGEGKVIVNDLGGAISIESAVQSGTVAVTDLTVGGTADDGTVDNASVALGLNVVASVAEPADLAGFDGNDRFTLDLGLNAYISSNDEAAIDLPAIGINLDAAADLTLDDVVRDINTQVLKNKLLSGLVAASNDNGRLKLTTTKTGQAVSPGDLVLANAVTGAPLPATDTLGALGFYVNPLTGVSGPATPATVAGAQGFPVNVAAGVNDTFTIDLGAASSNDGTNPGPQTVTVAPGAYATPAAFALALNNAIDLNPYLKNAVVAVVNGANVDLQTVATGSRVQPADLVLADGPLTPGTLASFGLSGPTLPGGGTTGGQGVEFEPDNIINTMLRTRDELYGFSAGASRLVNLQDESGTPLGLFPGDTIRISANGSSIDMSVQRFSTLQDLADQIQNKIGFSVEVRVQRDGTIRIFNPSTIPINGIQIQAFNQQGGPVAAFNAKFSTLSGNLAYRSQMATGQLFDDTGFQHLTNRIGNMDDGLTQVQTTLSVLGSRFKRLDLTAAQNDSVQVNLATIQSTNDDVDMADTLIQLKNAENVLNAALGTGAQLLPPSLFDFLR
jgi:flagellin-like hook-associated protein FlgL